MVPRLRLFALLFVLCLYSIQAQNSNPGTGKLSGIRDSSLEFSLGNDIYHGVFTGNGLLGTMTFLKDSMTINVRMGRTDLYDHRKGNDNLFQRPRLPLGDFEIQLSAPIVSTTGRVNILKAKSISEIFTSEGTLRIEAITFSTENYILLNIDHSQYKGQFQLEWLPAKSLSPRLDFAYVQKPKNAVPPNPDPLWSKTESTVVCVQPMLAGGGYGLGYKTRDLQDKTQVIFATDYHLKGDSGVKDIETQLDSFRWSKLTEKISDHENWWKNFYQKSAIDIPDQALQDFYNMQLYKLASATRADKPAIDLQGPWTAPTPWPGYWFNLNEQLTYSPVYTANHLELGESLIQMIDRTVENLRQNVPKEYRYNSIGLGRSAAPDMIRPLKLIKNSKEEIAPPEAELGDLTWLLFYYYKQYEYSQSPELKTKIFNLLKQSVNYYLHLLTKNDERKYHVSVKTYSPEYPKGYAYDTNYDLSILRWGLKTLMKLDQNKKDPLYDTWKEVSANLIEYPKNAGGFMIAKDVPYDISHRHYSHLLMIYPFYEINWDQKENRDLIKKSIDTWQSLPQAMQGYSLTGLASMQASMGEGDEAVKTLKGFLKKYVQPNTLYKESGPVIETPLSAMTSIEELYLQYWNGVTRVFPAIPYDWKNTSFENLRTAGAFLISGKRENGRNTEVRIFSDKGGEIRIKPNMNIKEIQGQYQLLKVTNGIYDLQIPKGQTIIMKD